MTTVIFKVAYARMFPDPVFNKNRNPRTEIKKHIFVCRCNTLTDLGDRVSCLGDIGFEPNARKQNTARRLYTEVSGSLIAKDDIDNNLTPDTADNLGHFHLKNNGIQMIAESVRKLDNSEKGEERYQVTFNLEERHGILNGAHTSELIDAHNANNEIPDHQYVEISIFTGVPESFIPNIAAARNSSMQVTEESILNLSKHFEWIEDIIPDELRNKVSWSENDDGDITVTEILALLTLINSRLFLNESNEHPTIAYTSSRMGVIKKFKENTEKYKSMSKILMDILELHDIVAHTAVDVYNKGVKENSEKDGRAGNLKIITTRPRGSFVFPFIGESGKSKLAKPALYPILASFRRFVKHNDKGEAAWIVPFDEVKEFWLKKGYELIDTAHTCCKSNNYNLNALGKDKVLWSSLHDKVNSNMYELGLKSPVSHR